MRSPAAAVAWEFRQRHRWGLIVLAGYLVVMVTIKLAVLARGRPIYLDSPESFGFVVMGPVTATFTYLLAVFSFGLDGDLGARRSMYPTRMFTRPLTTGALAGLPMLYGIATIFVLWLVTRLFALWPTGSHIPSLWPGLMLASLLAWTQALTWMPYPLPGLRIIVAVLWLGTIDTIAILALHFNARESLMLGILAPQIPLAYLVARFAVARARRGDVPDWRGGFVRLAQVADALSRRREHFRSAARAQAWFEWRRHGRSLPGWVAILLPFELVLLWVAGDSNSLVFTILLAVLLTPPFMATFAAAAVSKSSPDASDSYGVNPFIATRPLTNAELVAAKLKMAVWSTIAAWVLVLIAVALALELSGTAAVVLERWHRFSAVVGGPRAVVLLLLILWGCIASTWTQLVQSMYIGLTGRAALINGSVVLVLGFFVLFGPFAEWIVETRRLGEIWSALPLIFALLVALKMIAAGWIGVRLYHRRLVSDRTLVTGAACWSLAVFALYGVLIWLLDTPHIPHYLLMLVAILSIPLARLSAAPLALAWNRHR
ncbi:MAG: hypothetical protein DMD63_02545 [Gemmatimonadetes bacterium]|nr:MAG: hypothetical protein DMD63_02545 [Gemmatimonadota bacterium]